MVDDEKDTASNLLQKGVQEGLGALIGLGITIWIIITCFNAFSNPLDELTKEWR